MGSAGQPAESDFDSGADADASSGDEATALDYSDTPAYLTEEQQRRWRRFMKKPVREVQRIVRRALRGKSKGPGEGKGKRRRLHGRGVLAFLASLTGPQYEDMFLGAGRNRRHA
eukprot:5724300-Pyramimonas_sp.AAC.1